MDIKKSLQLTQQASRSLINLSEEKINFVLRDVADAIEKNRDEILVANRKDLERMDESNPKYDRLELNEERLFGIANDMNNVASLDYPIGNILEERTLDNGLELKKISVPLGVIGIIYEARPNVTFDVFSLCLKSGNACVLKGGSDAQFSNEEIVRLIHEVLTAHGIDPNILYLAPAGRECVKDILDADKYIDIIIPRGSQNLIDFVRENATVPVIETGAGIVHTYIDKSADLQKAKDIIFNAKTRRVSVCNALDTMIIHESQSEHVKEIVDRLQEKNVEIFADEKSFKVLENNYDSALLHQAKEEDFGIEFLSYKMSIKTVSSLDEALKHIATYSSKHSEAIVAEDEEVIEKFLNNVDAAAVYANTSTAYTDGAQFGLGAEIGISTQKLHARGPMALKELTSYKWIVKGDGQIRA